MAYPVASVLQWIQAHLLMLRLLSIFLVRMELTTSKLFTCKSCLMVAFCYSELDIVLYFYPISLPILPPNSFLKALFFSAEDYRKKTWSNIKET